MPIPQARHVDHGIYHVTLRGNRRQVVFLASEDRADLEYWVRHALQAHGALALAYCWMPNHLHLLVQVGTAPVGRVVQGFAGHYAKRFNWRHGQVGHLFQGRYSSQLVGTSAYLLNAVRYIHRNPVEAQLVPRPDHWPWSSARAYLGTPTGLVVHREPVLAAISDDPEAAARELWAFTMGDSEEWPDAAVVDLVVEPAVLPGPDAQVELHELVLAAGRRFGLQPEELTTGGSRRPVVDARCWVASEARRRGVATVAEVARLFGVQPSSLCRALRRRR